MTEQNGTETESAAEDGSSADGRPDEAGAADSAGSTDTTDPTSSTAPDDDSGTGADVAEQSADEELIERVADTDPETIAEELASLRGHVETLEAQLDDRAAAVAELESKLKRKQADFQNFKKRMKKRREEEQQRATEDLVSKLLDVRDNLQRALNQDEDVDIRDGVESTLRQFDDVLAAENVDVIEPEPGTEVDPQYHQVLARVDSEQTPGTIDDVHRPGYVMAEKVLREAQVTVADGDD